MKIVIDEKIPFLKDMLQNLGYDVLSKAGTEINRADVADAEALFVRTRQNVIQTCLKVHRYVL